MFFYTRLVSATTLGIHLLASGMLAFALPVLPSEELSSLAQAAPSSGAVLPSNANATLAQMEPSSVDVLARTVPAGASASLLAENGSVTSVAAAAATASVAVLGTGQCNYDEDFVPILFTKHHASISQSPSQR